MSKKENRLGINNLKVIVDFSVELSMVLITLKDKKGFFKKFAAFLSLLEDVPGVFLSAKMAVAEAGDIVPAEMDHLKEHVIDKFNIPNDRAELVVKNAVKTGVAIYNLIHTIKGLKTAA